MHLSKKKIYLAVAVAVPLLGVGLTWAYRDLAKELDSKFQVAIDSVPTRVFSAVHWIRKGDLASLDELRIRLKERDYKELKADAKLSPGYFRVVDRSDGSHILDIYLNSFEYPNVMKEMLFTDPQQIVGDKATFVRVYIEDGAVSKIESDTSDKEWQAASLEPVLVAQLNSSQRESRKTVALAEIPHTLLKAIVSVEDQRFLEHKGIDPRGIIRSMYVNISSGSYVQGASTITQQLIRGIYLSRTKTISRKLKEMVLAVMLEYRFSKDQILEKYLNEVYLGQSGNIAIHGVSQAAKFYFGKSLDELNTAEQALLAGIVRGPIYYSPIRHFDRAKERQEWVLKKMLENDAITEKQYNRAIKEPLKFAKVSPVQDRAPYFTDYVKSQLVKDLQESELLGAGYQIFSTIDTYYQQIAEKSVKNGLVNLEATLKERLKPKQSKNLKVAEAALSEELEEQRSLQGVFIAIDPKTNQLLAMVGGRSFEESNYNRALLMRRHVGSTFKPFVYLAALIHGKNPDGTPMNALTKFEDKEFTYEYDKQTWSPQNYEEGYLGTVTLRYALANSINTVAAQVATQVGLKNVIDAASAAGIETPLQPLPSVSLGAVELQPMEVVRAYSTLANYGLRRDITSVLAIIDETGKPLAKYLPREEQALPAPEVANLVDMMRSVFSIGTARYAKDLGFTYPAVGKTGTTNEFRDAWFVGFTPRILALSWVGFDRDDDSVKKHRKALKLTGAVGALPIWIDFMKTAHKGIVQRDFSVPDGLLRHLQVDVVSGGIATNRCTGTNVIDEVFTEKNRPTHDCD